MVWTFKSICKVWEISERVADVGLAKDTQDTVPFLGTGCRVKESSSCAEIIFPKGSILMN